MYCILILIILISIAILMRIFVGQERTSALLSRILSPVCIIIFYWTGRSLVGAFASILNIENQILQSASVKVAIDSAFVTLLINLILPLVSGPAKVKVAIRSNKNEKRIITTRSKPTKVMYQIDTDFKYKPFKWFYKDKIKLKIITPPNASFSVDKEHEYENKLDSDNISKYILVDLGNMLDSSNRKGVLYLDISMMSNKTIAWEDTLQCRLECSGIIRRFLAMFVWSFDQNNIEILHQEESND